MYINMECKSSYWEDSKPSVHIESNSYHGNGQLRESGSASPQMQPIHDDVCKEENSIYQYCDRNFNFSANVVGGGTSEEDDYHHTSPKRKIAVTRDPMSHRIIEKRRRDRMNNCLADLSRLIPAEYLKKGRGRIEKTEIIEMAIKHMKFLQAQTCSQGCNKSENCETKIDNGHRVVNDKQYQNGSRPEAEGSFQEQYKFGYQECLAETMHFLVELEGFFPTDALCVKLMGHLQKYYEKVAKGDKIVYRSPLENVSLPNTYEPKVNGFHASSINETNELNGRNSIISPAHYDDNSQNENVNGNSQLREMLVKPHLNPLYTPKVRPNIIRHSSPEPLSSPTDSINVDAHSSNGSLFKFKNYIKERFSAEHSSGTSSTESSSPTSVVACGHKRRAEYMTIDQPPSPDAKPIDDHYPIVSRPVPIFALHAKGSFYIPLTVDSHLLTPFVTELNSDYSHGFSPSMVLHPVTISVNFNRPSVSPNDIECKPLLPPMITNRIQNTPLLMVPECR